MRIADGEIGFQGGLLGQCQPVVASERHDISSIKIDFPAKVLGDAGWLYYAFSISRRDNTRSISRRMPSSLEMASDLSGGNMALSHSPYLSLNVFGLS